MADESPEHDSEIRRRAAWLLGMLALVAALFVTLMVTFFNTSGGDDNVDDLAGPTDAVAPTSAPRTSGSSSAPDTDGPDGSAPGSSTGSATGSATGTPSGTPGAPASCPDDDPCALDTDIGSAVSAINAYRAENGKKAVPGAISAAAKKCALSNGSDCSGGWAETQVPAQDGKPDGKAAVAKIQEFGKLLSDMKSIEIGWAYDPGSEQFYFAIVRND